MAYYERSEDRDERIRLYLLDDEHTSENEYDCDNDDESVEDHISESGHDTMSELDDTDADPTYSPSEDEPDENIAGIFHSYNIFESPNTVDEVIDEVIKKSVLGTSNAGNTVTEMETDFCYDSDIIPPSDEEEYRDYVSRMEVSNQDTIDIGNVNANNNVDHVIEEVVSGSGEIGSQELNMRYRVLLGKDNVTRWNKEPIGRSNVRTRSENIVRCLPGTIREAKEANTPLQCFNLMIDDQIIDIIVTNTNIYIETISVDFQRDRDCKQTNAVEIRAMLGLLILAGMMRSGHQNLKDLWARDGFGIEIFYTTMNIRRFTFLLRCIRFDNLLTRPARRQMDKFAPFRDVFEHFVKNCKKYFAPSCHTTVDEQLVAFRGKCPFRQFMKSKPAKYGIKIFTLTDAKMFYVKDMEVYLGLQPDGSQYTLSNKPHDVVLRLASTIEGSGRNITGDNWFSSIPLAKELLRKNLTYVGTIRKDKRELPPQFVSKKRNAYTSMFGFQENTTIVSYAPKNNRCVTLISTMHHDAAIDVDTKEKKKPEIVTYYNSTKSGVDVIDEKCGTYSTSRRSQRWPLVLFYRLLDIGGINAQVIFAYNTIESGLKMERRGFLKEIGMALAKPQISIRAEQKHLPRQLKATVSKHTGIVVQHAQPDNPNKKVRCSVCPRSKDVKTKFKCIKCNVNMCQSHMKNICVPCIEKPESDIE